MPKIVLIAIVSSVLLAGCSKRDETTTADNHAVSAIETTDLYSVADYDPARDASSDLAMTIDRAKADNKRIILEIGGQW